jgi:hypothetical protein
VGDEFLATTVAGINACDAEGCLVGITLTSHGFLIQGLLIPEREYWEIIQSQMDIIEARVGELQPVRALVFAERGIEAQRAAQAGEDSPECLHLRQPLLIGPNGDRFQFPYWRMRLDAVAGWALIYDPAGLSQPR